MTINDEIKKTQKKEAQAGPWMEYKIRRRITPFMAGVVSCLFGQGMISQPESMAYAFIGIVAYITGFGMMFYSVYKLPGLFNENKKPWRCRMGLHKYKRDHDKSNHIHSVCVRCGDAIKLFWPHNEPSEQWKSIFKPGAAGGDAVIIQKGNSYGGRFCRCEFIIAYKYTVSGAPVCMTCKKPINYKLSKGKIIFNQGNKGMEIGAGPECDFTDLATAQAAINTMDYRDDRKKPAPPKLDLIPG